jgi:hypothetical protein
LIIVGMDVDVAMLEAIAKIPVPLRACIDEVVRLAGCLATSDLTDGVVELDEPVEHPSAQAVSVESHGDEVI